MKSIHSVTLKAVLLGGMLAAVGASAFANDKSHVGTDAAHMQVKEAVVSDTMGQKIDDAGLTTKIKAALLKDERVSMLRISVKTEHNGHVRLKGNVKTAEEAAAVLEVVKAVEGVDPAKVKSQLRVKP